MTKLTVSERDAWAEALENGKYKQGKHALYNDINDSYCCLGVFAEVLCLPKNENDYFCDAAGAAYHGEYGAKLAPLFDNRLSEYTINTLINYNDVTNFRFQKIATYVRKLPCVDEDGNIVSS